MFCFKFSLAAKQCCACNDPCFISGPKCSSKCYNSLPHDLYVIRVAGCPPASAALCPPTLQCVWTNPLTDSHLFSLVSCTEPETETKAILYSVGDNVHLSSSVKQHLVADTDGRVFFEHYMVYEEQAHCQTSFCLCIHPDESLLKGRNSKFV